MGKIKIEQEKKAQHFTCEIDYCEYPIDEAYKL
jgi:hypothetical protein